VTARYEQNTNTGSSDEPTGILPATERRIEMSWSKRNKDQLTEYIHGLTFLLSGL
jgi:hypothetical protein